MYSACIILGDFFFFFFRFSYLVLVTLGLCCCAQTFSSCRKRGLLFVVVCELLIEVASLVVEHGLQLLHGMWDLPRPRIEPTSPALAGEFLTTRPPGKPPNLFSGQPGNGVILGIGLSLGLAGTWIHIQPASSGKPSVPCQPLTRRLSEQVPTSLSPWFVQRGSFRQASMWPTPGWSRGIYWALCVHLHT